MIELEVILKLFLATMGKDKKTKKRSIGLTEDILESKTVKPSGRFKQRRERQGESDDTVRSVVTKTRNDLQ